jgi:spore coat polysaccharide biosynthesis predicted glycosyltransferase SpsG
VLNRAVFYCDLGPVKGAGHLMRCVALAEELVRRGVACSFVADFDSVPWAAEQVASRGFARVVHAGEPDAALGRLLALSPDAVVLDTYVAPPSLSAAIRATGVPVLAIVDGDLRGQDADLYVDQNIGAEELRPPLPGQSTMLAGLDYALVRDEVVRHRPPEPPASVARQTPRVLAYFGGTDPFGAGPAVAEALVQTGRPFHATIVAPRPEHADAIHRLVPGLAQHLEVIGPPPSLMALAAEADLVVSASGTSLVELFCLGSASAIVCVAENQERGYDLATARGLAAGIGHLLEVRRDPGRAAQHLRLLLDEASARDSIRRAGWAAVDGRGRERVADALALVTERLETR